METRRRRIAWRRYIVPICFVCCLCFVGASLAKMSVESPIERNSEIDVAAWNVDVRSADSGNMTLDAGKGSKSYSLLVTNNSDVASTYQIKVSNIPAGVKIGLDINSNNDLVTPVAGEVVFTNTGGDLGHEAPNNSRTHSLTLAADATAEVTNDDVNMAIEVLFEQKDPRL